jgi:peptide/nickel transport system substrate-binding protein
MGQDWRRGPAGENLNDFAAGSHSLEDSMMPIIAESWEMPAQGVWVLNIRQGVRWQKTPFPASVVLNGRELTAKDVVDSFNWQVKEQKKSWIWVSQPKIAEASTIEQTGPWQVTIKTPIDYLTSFTWLIQGAGYHRVFPVEVARKLNWEWIYQGDGWDYKEWIGTGPWIRTEVVAGSRIVQTRNKDYWETDPLSPGKGNQLPYVDTYVQLLIPDRSTQLAALRTGKIDFMTGLTRDEWKREMELSPRYMSASTLNDTTQNRVFFMRTDKKDKPFSNVKVRQAMMMSIDFNAIKEDLYGGAAEIDVWPLNSNFKGTGVYAPLNEMPAEVQELYTYNTDKAKQLLKEAGYPNGFKASVIVNGGASGDVDDVSIFKDYWKKVGIELVLDVREASTFSTIQATRNFNEMLYRFNYSNWPQDFYFTSRRGASSNNLSFVNDPAVDTFDQYLEDAFNKVNDAMMVDMPTVYKTMREIRPYIMQSATVIPRPTPLTYNVWNPWLKNYYGFAPTGYKYVWIDQDMKKSLGY